MAPFLNGGVLWKRQVLAKEKTTDELFSAKTTMHSLFYEMSMHLKVTNLTPFDGFVVV